MAINVTEQLNSMGLNIDRATLQQVSQSILKRAEQKNSQYNVDNAQNFFQKRDIGVDLYNGKIDLKVANQIALNNSGLQVQLSQDTLAKINYLNAAAAVTQKNVDGKLTIAVNEITLKEQTAPINSNNRIVTNETAKDKNGSNPFYHGELLMTENSSGHKEDSGNEKQAIMTSIFA